MSMRLALLSDGLLHFAQQRGFISKRQVNATMALTGVYHTRDFWGPTAARVIGRAAGFGSKPLIGQIPTGIPRHPGTIGFTKPRVSGRKIPGLRAGVGRALGWASVVWFFATVESPGEVIEN